MKSLTPLDRLMLLGTILLAAYQIVVGIDSNTPMAILSYTVAFGVLLVASLLIFVLGFDILDSPMVVIVSTLIPLGISLGLMAEFFSRYTSFYIWFVILGFLAIAITRYALPGKLAVIVLAVVHGISGLLIFGLPIYLVIIGEAPYGSLFFSLGGALIGIGGLLLSFLKTGRPILSRTTIMGFFPTLLFATTCAFVSSSIFS
jgi:hypothetical protein